MKVIELREQLAQASHDIWADWMRYLLSQCRQETIVIQDNETFEPITRYITAIPRTLTNRWLRQMNTAYSELSENEKQSDRQCADRLLAVIKKHKKNTPTF